jgi:glycosyltransferase involved in cell wall biosynthesis
MPEEERLAWARVLSAHPSREPRAVSSGGPAAADDDANAVVLVVPVVPQTTGNGLAMRAGMLLEALASRCPVDLLMVPVSGPAAATAWAGGLARSLQIVGPAEGAAARRHVTLQLADATLRRRLQATAPLPLRVRAAPPTLAADAFPEATARTAPPQAVFVLRGYLAPFGCTLARRLSAKRIVIDVDDDDEQLARSSGALDEADAVARVARAWLPEADVVCAAAHNEAHAIAARYGLSAVVTLPNAVRIPARAPAPPPGDGRLLFVGNLTYAPNVEAARLLVEEVLPLVLLEHPEVTVDLVGPHAGGLPERPGVRILGMVDELEPCYRRADVVVAPLLRGSGTRIKVLEAFAHRRPLAATTVAVAGLAVRDGRDVLIGDSPQALARAIVALLDDPQAAARIVQCATRTLEARYVQNVVAPLICKLATGEPLERGEAMPEEPR